MLIYESVNESVSSLLIIILEFAFLFKSAALLIYTPDSGFECVHIIGQITSVLLFLISSKYIAQRHYIMILYIFLKKGQTHAIRSHGENHKLDVYFIII